MFEKEFPWDHDCMDCKYYREFYITIKEGESGEIRDGTLWIPSCAFLSLAEGTILKKDIHGIVNPNDINNKNFRLALKRCKQFKKGDIQ